MCNANARHVHKSVQVLKHTHIIGSIQQPKNLSPFNAIKYFDFHFTVSLQQSQPLSPFIQSNINKYLYPTK